MTTIRIWFTKTGEAFYISLLDLQRVMQRALKRSGLPVWYTLGFNPHIYMTFAAPLSLGQESLAETVDFKCYSCDANGANAAAITGLAATQLAAHATNNDNVQIAINVRDAHLLASGKQHVWGMVLRKDATGKKDYVLVQDASITSRDMSSVTPAVIFSKRARDSRSTR